MTVNIFLFRIPALPLHQGTAKQKKETRNQEYIGNRKQKQTNEITSNTMTRSSKHNVNISIHSWFNKNHAGGASVSERERAK